MCVGFDKSVNIQRRATASHMGWHGRQEQPPAGTCRRLLIQSRVLYVAGDGLIGSKGCEMFQFHPAIRTKPLGRIPFEMSVRETVSARVATNIMKQHTRHNMNKS